MIKKLKEKKQKHTSKKSKSKKNKKHFQFDGIPRPSRGRGVPSIFFIRNKKNKKLYRSDLVKY